MTWINDVTSKRLVSATRAAGFAIAAILILGTAGITLPGINLNFR
jgi:hypothetical protein